MQKPITYEEEKTERKKMKARFRRLIALGHRPLITALANSFFGSLDDIDRYTERVYELMHSDSCDITQWKANCGRADKRESQPLCDCDGPDLLVAKVPKNVVVIPMFNEKANNGPFVK